jgi:hypothetical protein
MADQGELTGEGKEGEERRGAGAGGTGGYRGGGRGAMGCCLGRGAWPCVVLFSVAFVRKRTNAPVRVHVKEREGREKEESQGKREKEKNGKVFQTQKFWGRKKITDNLRSWFQNIFVKERNRLNYN